MNFTNKKHIYKHTNNEHMQEDETLEKKDTDSQTLIIKKDDEKVEKEPEEKKEPKKPVTEEKTEEPIRPPQFEGTTPKPFIVTRDDVEAWYSRHGWKENPFTFNILPMLFVGYKEEREKILVYLQEKHKFILVLGHTGSGKTTLLKWILTNISKDSESIYIGKPPERPEDFIDIINNKYRIPWILRPFRKRVKNIYQLPDFLNKKLKKKNLIILIDEAHEANLDVLEWIRVLGDQVNNLSFLISALPVFEEDVLSKLETFAKRIAAKVELLSLTKEETEELIIKRILYVNGKGDEFAGTFDYIFDITGGFPREIIRACNEIINRAIANNKDQLT